MQHSVDLNVRPVEFHEMSENVTTVKALERGDHCAASSEMMQIYYERNHVEFLGVERRGDKAVAAARQLSTFVHSGYVAVSLTVTKLKPSRLASETIMTGLWARLLFCIRAERTARCWGRWPERLVYLKGIRLVGG